MPSFTKIYHVANIADLKQRELFLRGEIFENRVLKNSDRKDSITMVLVCNTGDLYGFTPFRSDFIDYVKCDIPVKDVTKVNRVIVIKTNLHKFI